MTNAMFDAETDSYGDTQNHKLDHMIGNRTRGQLVQIEQANHAIPTYLVANPYPYEELPTSAVQNATTVAYATNLVVKVKSGFVFGMSGYNSGPAQWIQIHDATALPANASVPKVIIAVPTLSNFSILFGGAGRLFSTGIVICNSTTGPTKTIGSADCWFDVQYV